MNVGRAILEERRLKDFVKGKNLGRFRTGRQLNKKREKTGQLERADEE